MSELEHLQTLISEIGPLIDGIEAIDQEGEDYWLFSFGEDTVLQIQHDEEARKLVIFADLGVPSEEHQLPIYEAILSFNYLWSETGGVRMAIAGPGGAVSQVLDLFTLDLDGSTLGTVIENFLDKAMYWREFIANYRVPSDADSDELPHDEGSAGPAIRV